MLAKFWLLPGALEIGPDVMHCMDCGTSPFQVLLGYRFLGCRAFPALVLAWLPLPVFHFYPSYKLGSKLTSSLIPFPLISNPLHPNSTQASIMKAGSFKFEPSV
jgi:hypothetical protein